MFAAMRIALTRPNVGHRQRDCALLFAAAVPRRRASGCACDPDTSGYELDRSINMGHGSQGSSMRAHRLSSATPARSAGKSKPGGVVLLAGIVIALAVGGYLLYPTFVPEGEPEQALPRSRPEPVREPAGPPQEPQATTRVKPPQPVVPPPPPPSPSLLEEEAVAASPLARGDSARDVIERITNSDDPEDYGQAYAEAQAFQAAGRTADAHLLYFFAARGGHAPAAMALASGYDPNHWTAETSMMDAPEPFQAYKWYSRAAQGGEPLAAERLAALRGWAETAAQAGNTEAQGLLLQWQ
jgi:hypothetical protein